jgi:ABC-2 type transport system permease protein
MGGWYITCKDLLLLTRDRRAAATLLLMPIVFIAILGFSTGRLVGWKDKNEMIDLAVVDEDGGLLAADVVKALGDRKGFQVTRAADERAARDLVDEDECVAAVLIGPNFQQKADELELRDVLDTRQGRLATGLQALDVTLYVRPAMATTGAIVEQLVFWEAMRALVPHVAGKDPLVKALVQARGQLSPQASASQSDSDSKDFDTGLGSRVYQVLVPSYTVMFAFFLINIMAHSFITERDLGTLRRLQAAPIGPFSLVAGKTAPFYIISLAQGLLLFLFGKLLFGMSWGPTPWVLPLVIAATSLAATTLGLLTATMVRSDAQVSAYATLMVITLAGISGCFMPRDWLPDLMRKVSLATPHAWALIAYQQLLATDSPNLSKVWQSCGILVGFSMVFFSLGWLRFRSTT